MTDPYETDWADVPGLTAEAPGATPLPPRRAWYRAPGSLIGAATYSALMSWLVLGGAVLVHDLFTGLEESGLFGLFFALLLLAFAPLLVVVGILFVGGLVATVPLAVVWARDPARSTAAGVALAHAVVAWAALAVVLVRYAT